MDSDNSGPTRNPRSRPAPRPDTPPASPPQDGAPERDLITRAQAGDLAAFDQIVTLHRQSAFSMIHAILRNEQDAWDVSQEGFLRAWRALPRFRGDSSFSTWLHRIMSNAALDFLRRARARQTSSLHETHTPGDAPEEPADPAPSASPAAQLRLSELRERINSALSTLSPEHRAVILLKEAEGLQYHEIADRLGISLGTVMSRLFYARKKLQKLLRDLYENEP